MEDTKNTEALENEALEEEQAQDLTEQEEQEDVKKEDEKKYSDKDVDKILSDKFAKWKKQQEKEVNEAKKLADMSAQEKADLARKKLEEKVAELERANILNEMTKTARSIMSESGVNVSDNLLSALVSTDADSTKEAVDGFIKLFKEAVDTEVKKKLKGSTPKGNPAGKSKMTKDQIMAIKDGTERRKAIQENIELFN